MSLEELLMTPKPRSWGGWKVARGGKHLRHANSPSDYRVPIASSAAEALARVNCLEQEAWMSHEMLRGLVVALVENLPEYPSV